MSKGRGWRKEGLWSRVGSGEEKGLEKRRSWRRQGAGLDKGEEKGTGRRMKTFYRSRFIVDGSSDVRWDRIPSLNWGLNIAANTGDTEERTFEDTSTCSSSNSR